MFKSILYHSWLINLNFKVQINLMSNTVIQLALTEKNPTILIRKNIIITQMEQFLAVDGARMEFQDPPLSKVITDLRCLLPGTFPSN